MDTNKQTVKPNSYIDWRNTFYNCRDIYNYRHGTVLGRPPNFQRVSRNGAVLGRPPVFRESRKGAVLGRPPGF